MSANFLFYDVKIKDSNATIQFHGFFICLSTNNTTILYFYDYSQPNGTTYTQLPLTLSPPNQFDPTNLKFMDIGVTLNTSNNTYFHNLDAGVRATFRVNSSGKFRIDTKNFLGQIITTYNTYTCTIEQFTPQTKMYSIIIKNQSALNVFAGYFTLITLTNTVQNFYDYSQLMSDGISYVDVNTSRINLNQIDPVNRKFTNIKVNINTITNNYFNNLDAGNNASFSEVPLSGLNITTFSATSLIALYTTYTYTIEEITSPACFGENTQILCFDSNDNIEKYVKISELKIDDLVKTYKHGYKKIKHINSNNMINNPDLFWNCIYKMPKNDSNNLIDDLYLTGFHSILVDNFNNIEQSNIKLNDDIFLQVYGTSQIKIDDKYMITCAFSQQFEPLDNNLAYKYYNFALESDDPDAKYGIWANGLLVESTNVNHFTPLKI